MNMDEIIENSMCSCGKCDEVDIRRVNRLDSNGDLIDYTDYMYCKNCRKLVDVCP